MISILFVFALMMANLPFFNEKLLGFVPLKQPYKHIGWRCAEIIFLYFVFGRLALFLEAQQGPVHTQHWQFYTATFCLFLLLTFPGIVIRYFWRKPGI